jgi:TonB family protein
VESGLSVSVAKAQEAVPKMVSGGVLNGKARLLPKPAFPQEARAVGATGAVSVQVLIDENGVVVSANAVSGHPLLREAAAEAAKGAKFSPTLLDGVPVRVTGVITYNFVLGLQAARIAFILTHAELTSSFGEYGAPESFASQLPNDWSDEKAILKSLTFEQFPETKAEEKKVSTERTGDPPPVKDNNRYTVKGDVNYAVAGGAQYGPRKLDASSIGSVQRVSRMIEARASAVESKAWAYELGKALGRLAAEIDDTSKFQSDLAAIESLSGRAPATVVQSSLQQLNAFIEFAKKEGIHDDNGQEVLTRVGMLSNLRY